MCASFPVYPMSLRSAPESRCASDRRAIPLWIVFLFVDPEIRECQILLHTVTPGSLQDSLEQYGAGADPIAEQLTEQLGTILEESIKPASARAQALGEFVDFDSGGTFFDQSLAGGIKPDLSPKGPLLSAAGGDTFD